jgi:hypothetical protein
LKRQEQEKKEREIEKQRRPAYDDFLKTAIYSIGLVKDTQDICMARMYNREKNNTSTTIYPKCHNTKSKECLVPILFSPFL